MPDPTVTRRSDEEIAADLAEARWTAARPTSRQFEAVLGARQRLVADVPALLAESSRLRAAVEAVRELHVGGMYRTDRCAQCGRPVPCPTVAALAAAEQDGATTARWDHATLDELVRRRDTFTASWGEHIDEMKAETRDGAH